MGCIQSEITDLLESKIYILEKTINNVRRGIFSRHDDLGKKYQSVQQQLDRLTEGFCIMKRQIENYELLLFPDREEEG